MSYLWLTLILRFFIIFSTTYVLTAFDSIRIPDIVYPSSAVFCFSRNFCKPCNNNNNNDDDDDDVIYTWYYYREKRANSGRKCILYFTVRRT